MRRAIMLTLIVAAVFATVPAHLPGRIVAQDPDGAREQAPPDLTPPAPMRAEPRPGVAPDALTTPPVELSPGVARERPSLPAGKPLTEPPGGDKSDFGPEDLPPARPRPEGGDAVGGQGVGFAGNVSYTAAATITYNASSDGTVQIVSIVFTPGFTYRFYDSGGVVPGSGCVFFSAVEADCPAPGAVLIVSNLGPGIDSYYQDGLHPADGLNVFGGTEDDAIIIGGTGVAVGGPSYVQGDGGDDRAYYSDQNTSTAQTYTITSASVARSGAGTMSYNTDRVQLNAGYASDTIAVNSTFSGVIATEVYPGIGELNAISVGTGDLDLVAGWVGIYGYAADVLTVNDSVASYTDSYGVTATEFSRTFFPGLYYSVGTLSIFGQTSGNTWTVTGTGPLTTLNGGAGGDTVGVGTNLDFLSGTLTVNPGGGNDALTIDDTANPVPDTITVANTSVTRAFSGGVAFNGSGDLENLTVQTQEVGSQVQVDSTASPSTAVSGRGGDDLFVVGDGFMDNLFTTAVVDGGSGVDTLFVDDTLNGFNDSYTVTTNVIGRNSSAGTQFSAFESVALFSGIGHQGFTVSSTAAIPYHLDLGDGNDLVSAGPDLSLLAGPLSVVGNLGSDTLEYRDTASITSNVYEIRGGQRMDRIGVPSVQYASIETDTLLAGLGNDVIRLMSTQTGTNTSAHAYLGNDTAQLFAAGLAGIGAASLYGGSDSDTLAVYSGGLGSFFIPPDTVSTPGRHNVLHFEFETTGISATGPDSDGDSCPDAFEVGIDANFGGLRNPADFYDWFDVADPVPPPAPDRAIDLNDTLAVLGQFGLLPGDAGYSPIYDRMAGPALQIWRTRPATGAQVGIDLQDALASLQSFGHICQS